jgi:uncharacterized damage-inducible protein DinB
VDLEQGTSVAYLRHAFDQVLSLVDQLGPARLNERPAGRGTNSVGALVHHCCAVCEFWLGHVALGRPTSRDRDAEFTRRTTPRECHEAVAAALRQAEEDVARLMAGAGLPHEARSHLPGGVSDDAAVLLHVLEELYQHLGQMEITKDVLLEREPGTA